MKKAKQNKKIKSCVCLFMKNNYSIKKFLKSYWKLNKNSLNLLSKSFFSCSTL